MQQSKSRLTEIISEFESLSIDYGFPGFYDQNNFLNAEKLDNKFLENYALFIDNMNFEPEYLKRSSNKIKLISNILHTELHIDGRLGSCIDMALVLSRILEKEKIWNYMVCGSLTISYPANSGIPETYFWDMDFTNAKAGHAWIVAPPYRVIDLTLKIQPYKMNNVKYLPDYILMDSYNEVPHTVEDICSPEVILSAKYLGIDKKDLIFHYHPERVKFYNEFKANFTKIKGTSFKYLPASITAPDCPLESITSLKLNNRFGIDIYNELLKPYLS